IQAVNLIGSLFYPTVLGIFIVAFFFTYIKSSAVFIGALISQAMIVVVHYLNVIGEAGFLTMGFLWYNALGCFLVVLFGFALQFIFNRNKV
ncbi:MAG: sodium:solute symporter, partial [Fulvivirga sp.]|nr:sodium:solute symporter [Fulvivirga sp.]